MNTVWWPDSRRESSFLSPSSIHSGAGSRGLAGDVLRDEFRAPPGPVLVVADDVVIANGLLVKVVESLARFGYDAHVISGLGPEPSNRVLDAAAAEARAVGATAVVGVGGGSVLDSAKVLALLLCNEGAVGDWLGPVDPPRVAPLLLAPTTCGTGSEATRIAMVTVEGAKRAISCAAFIPRGVIIDPELVASLPAGVIASTGMDALAHAVESLMSTMRSPMTAHHALRAVELLTASLEDAVRGDERALERCLWASHLAGQALNAGVVLGHSLAYCIAFEHPMPHGTACALALPYCIAYNSALPEDLAAGLASALTQGAAIDLRSAAAAVKELAERIGLPTTLADAGIASGAEASIAARCVREYPRPTNPHPLDVDALERLAIAMRTGDLDAAFAASRAA